LKLRDGFRALCGDDFVAHVAFLFGNDLQLNFEPRASRGL
jgi:hypothetical protein